MKYLVKRFSQNPTKYVPTGERLRRSISSGIKSGTTGAIVGGLLGSIGGFKGMKRGAAIAGGFICYLRCKEFLEFYI
jgi:uncharacterized protein YcfJ